MKIAKQWIEQLNLGPHPEGGYYKQTDHADEMWVYHTGNPLTVHSLHEDGRYTKAVLGLGENENLRHNVHAGTIFGSTVEEGYALVSCTVVPDFDFADFKLFIQDDFLKKYPQHKKYPTFGL